MSEKIANRISIWILLLICVILAVEILISAADKTPVMAKQQVPQGNIVQAPQAFAKYGCGTCHAIPGIPGADGMVGPNLEHLSQRSLLAGRLPNTPDNLMMWIQHPQHVHPGGDMPEMGVSDADARDMAAYLYSLP